MKSIIILAVAASLATAASASTRDIVVADGASAHVSYSDLDVKSAAGQRALADRIRSAARTLCVENNVEPLSTKMDELGCYRVALHNGMTEMSRVSH